MKNNEIDLKKAIAYGVGRVCGKHNLPMTKKEIKKIVNQGIKELKK